MLSDNSSTRLLVSVEDGLVDMDVLVLSKIVGDLVPRMIFLHPGETFAGSETGLLLILEALQLFELALIFVIVLVGILVLSLLFVIPYCS